MRWPRWRERHTWVDGVPKALRPETSAFSSSLNSKDSGSRPVYRRRRIHGPPSTRRERKREDRVLTSKLLAARYAIINSGERYARTRRVIHLHEAVRLTKDAVRLESIPDPVLLTEATSPREAESLHRALQQVLGLSAAYFLTERISRRVAEMVRASSDRACISARRLQGHVFPSGPMACTESVGGVRAMARMAGGGLVHRRSASRIRRETR